MKDLEEKSPAEQVVIRLRRSGHFLHYYMGGRSGRRRVLMFLYDHGEMPQKTMQALMHVQAGSLSEVIISLEKEDLLKKERSRTDGRQWLLRLTPAGEEMACQVKRDYETQIAAMMACFNDEELQQMNAFLEKMLLHWDSVAAQHTDDASATMTPWAGMDKEMKP